MTAPVSIGRLPSGERRRAVQAHIGRLVTVTVDIHRDGSNLTELRGNLLAVARPYGPGPQSDVVVLRTEDHDTRAIAITRVRAITAVGR